METFLNLLRDLDPEQLLGAEEALRAEQAQQAQLAEQAAKQAEAQQQLQQRQRQQQGRPAPGGAGAPRLSAAPKLGVPRLPQRPYQVCATLHSNAHRGPAFLANPAAQGAGKLQGNVCAGHCWDCSSTHAMPAQVTPLPCILPGDAFTPRPANTPPSSPKHDTPCLLPHPAQAPLVHLPKMLVGKAVAQNAPSRHARSDAVFVR